MKKYNISKPEKYISNGVEKTYWANVGTMTEWPKEDGSVSRIIEIPAIGLKANVFPIVPKPATSEQPKKEYAGEATPEEIASMDRHEEGLPDVKDIPF